MTEGRVLNSEVGMWNAECWNRFALSVYMIKNDPNDLNCLNEQNHPSAQNDLNFP